MGRYQAQSRLAHSARQVDHVRVCAKNVPKGRRDGAGARIKYEQASLAVLDGFEAGFAGVVYGCAHMGLNVYIPPKIQH